MRLAFGCDHAGHPLKEPMISALEQDGHHVLDLGTFSSDPVDYPDFARAVGNAVRNGFVDLGILVCGSGVGAAIAANKIRGVRAALCTDLFTARQSRADDDANVLCLGARVLDPDTAMEITREWLATEFSGEERHVRRIQKITQLEQGIAPGAGEKTVRREPPPTRPAPPREEEPPRPRGAPRPAPVVEEPPARPAARVAPERPAAPARPAARQPVPSEREPVTLEPSLADEMSKVIQEFDREAGVDEEPPPRPAARVAPERQAAPARPAPKAPPAAPPPPLPPPPPHLPPPPMPAEQFARTASEALRTLEDRGFVESLWIKDASLWTDDGHQQALIRNRLGWLTSPTLMRQHADDLKEFADEVRRSHYTHILLLGMGGAVLCPEVLSLTFGPKMGFPDLVVLDSTDPAAVKAALGKINLPRTLIVVSSKSGLTAETMAFYAFFREQIEKGSRGKPGLQFVAITDGGSPLEKLAKSQGFRKVFLNPPTIGGRYSALSYFGLLPAALVGMDVAGILDRAVAAVEEAGDGVPIRDNPGVVLGAKLASLAKAGRDKVTFVFSPGIAPFGTWVEQLLAESLGKNGRGLIPVDGEPLGAPAVYGPDRVFVAMTLADEAVALESPLAALEEAGHPVIKIRLRDPLDIGTELYRWEIATATIGALLQVNPFDEPNVQESKDITAKLLTAYRTSRRLPEWAVDREEDGIALMTGAGTKPLTVSEGLGAHMALAKPGDYLAFQAYLPPRPEIPEALQELRRMMRDKTKLAVTVGMGPRYLHSTGQLHKGGPPNGLFIQLTADDAHDLAIPGEPYSFAVLKNAQALGDLQALRNKGRRVIRVHLGSKDSVETLKKFAAMLARSVPAH
ncbi:MAG: transaldolase, transaldolase / glucose-6-phosphate isomerase [Candidatus Rokubacteria bacterium CSP1-6]|nr:MAG: transaldolase, transaldolase / glucose-6-phosphate isomerase [Candidatus Rokubacteria bacterium CSP1-6]